MEEVKFTFSRSNAIIQQQKQYPQQSKAIMNKALLILNLIIITTQINAMLTEIFPPEINKKFLFLAPLCSSKLEKSSKIMNACTQVCWSWNRFVNDQDRTLTWIKRLTKKHDLSDMDVTEQLRTNGGFNRYTLQKSCFVGWSTVASNSAIDHLNRLKKGGLDLNFTHEQNKSTVLAKTTENQSYGYHEIAIWYLENGADINMQRGSDGRTALMIALSVSNNRLLIRLINHPDYRPNDKDNNGNTPLLCALEGYNNWPFADAIKTIQQLLEKGADPELGNNDGLTPLKQAESRNNLTLINLLKDAVVKKHST